MTPFGVFIVNFEYILRLALVFLLLILNKQIPPGKKLTYYTIPHKYSIHSCKCIKFYKITGMSIAPPSE